MAWTTDDIPNLVGKVAVVTGANSGLGYESTKALARAGAHVVMAARNQDKATAARDMILADQPDASLDLVRLDLGSFEPTATSASQIASSRPEVDILINNAGLMAMPERRTDDGYEMQFGVNHLGHWVFTAGLLASLLRAERARIVTVTSTAHHMGKPVDPDDVNLDGNYSAWGAYGRAKLANYHFALGLQDEFDRRSLPAQSLSAHPGLSNTNLQAHTVAEGGGGRAGDIAHWLVNKSGMPQDRGALSQLRAATDPAAKGGELYGPRFVNWGPPVRRPVLRPGAAEAIQQLWMVSERETGVRLDFDSTIGPR